MKDTTYIKTSDGNEIEITQDMLEDLSVISGIYNMPVKSLIEEFLDGEFETKI